MLAVTFPSTSYAEGGTDAAGTATDLFNATANSDFPTGGSLVFRVTNVQSGDRLDFTAWPSVEIDLGTAVSAPAASGQSNITYTVGVSGTTTTVTFTGSGNALNAGKRKDAFNAVTFWSTSQNPARASNPTVTVTEVNGGTTTSIASTTVTVTNANDAPVLGAASPTQTLANVAGASGAPTNGSIANSTLVSSLLGNATDVDTNAVKGMAIVSTNTTNGTLWYSTNGGTTWTRVDAAGAVSGASSLLLASDATTRLYWQPAANVGFSGTAFTFRAWDQTSGTAGGRLSTGTASRTAIPNDTLSFSSATDTVNASVSGSNTAPTLDAAQSPAMAAVNEDTAAPTNGSTSSSTLISSLVAGIADADAGAAKGIAITAVNTANGSLWYTTNGGTSWAQVGTVSVSSALLLASDASTRVAFVPSANFNGTIGDVFTFRAWDQTSGSAGTKVDTSVNGVASAFSTATDTVAITASPVNDAPVRTAGTPAAITAIEDGGNSTATSLGLSGLAYGPGGGSDESSQTLTHRVTAVPSFVALFKADGTTPVPAGTAVTLTELRGLTYKTVADGAGSGFITWAVVDSGGTASGGVDTLTESLAVMVTAVNDAPSGTDKTVTINQNTNYTFSVSDFDLTDTRDNPANPLAAVKITTLPVAGTLKLANADVSVGQVVPLASLGGLVYTPVGGASGSPYASFTFQVQDSGGTANGGVNLDPSPNTFTINVGKVDQIAPAFASPATASIQANTNILYKAVATDTVDYTDGVVTYGLQANSAKFNGAATTLSINASTGVVSTASGLAQAGTYTFTVTAADATGNTGSLAVTVTVSSLASGPIDLTSASSQWNVLLAGANYDPPDDTQANASKGLDLLGDASLPMMYMRYSASANNGDGEVAFRIREESVNPKGVFYLIGLVNPAVNDTKILGFIGLYIDSSSNLVNGVPSKYSISFYDPGSGTNTSPSTSSFLTKGATAAVNGAAFVMPVGGGSDLDPADTSGPDGFVSFKFNAKAFETWAKSRLTPGTNSYVVADPLAMVVMTATQSNSINGDFGGIRGSSSQSYKDLGIATPAAIANNPPQSYDTTVTTPEDTAIGFSAASFPFADGDAGDTLQKVRIDTLPARGTLTLAGVPISAGTVVTAANLGSLVYTPPTDENGAAFTTFTFSVNDGKSWSATPQTLTVNVTPVNDPPVISLLDGDVSYWTTSNVAIGIDAAPRAVVSDIDSPNFNGGVLTIAVTGGTPADNALSIVTVGTVALTGSNVLVNGVTIGTIGGSATTLTVALNANATPAAVSTLLSAVRFTYSGNEVAPAYRTLTVTVTDGSGGTSNTPAVTLVGPPIYTVQGNEDTPIPADQVPVNVGGGLTLGDIAAASGSFVKLLAVTSGLSFTRNGSPRTAVVGDVLTIAELRSLRFTPAANEYGDGLASFRFGYCDAAGNPTGALQQPTVVFNVLPLNDPPAAVSDGASGAVLTGSITELVGTSGSSQARTASGRVVFSDADFSDTISVAYQGVNGYVWSGGSIDLTRQAALDAAISLSLGAVSVATTPVAQVATAAWTFMAADGAFDFVGKNETLAISRTVRASDGNGGTATTVITVTVTGTNDGVVITTTDPAQFGGTTAEVADSTSFNPTTLSGTIAFADLDVKDTHVVTAATPFIEWNDGSGLKTLADLEAAIGTAALNSLTAALGSTGTFMVGGLSESSGSGSFGWTFTPTAAIEFLPIGQSLRLTYTLQVDDQKGGLATQDVVLVINGANDTPAPTYATDRSAFENGALVTGQLTSTDVDYDATTSYELVGDPIAGLTISPDGSFSFDPGNPAYTSLGPGSTQEIMVTYRVTDDRGASATRSFMISVIGINNAPAGADKAVTVVEDGSYVFETNDFGFTDPNDSPANTLLSVKFTTLPAAGTLRLNGAIVTPGQSVTAVDIAGGKLVFTPAANANGTPLTSFTFQVRDNGGTANGGVDLDQSPNTITVNVTAVNDAPSGTDATVTVLEDGSYSFTALDFSFADPNDTPGNALVDVTIVTLPAKGTLKFDGNSVTAGQVIAVADLGKLVYAPAADDHGPGYASFTFKVRDDGGTANGGVDLDQSPNTITVNVTSVNDAPSGIDASINVHQDEPMLLTGDTFGFTDVDGNSRWSVFIDSLPEAGQLQWKNGTGDWVSVTVSQEITVAEIVAGRLRFAPAEGAATADPYASFHFRVRDDGGTANGGIDTDPTANTITIRLLDYRGPRLSVPVAQQTDEDAPLIFSAANGNAITIVFIGEDGIDNDVETIRTTLSVTRGTLTLGSTPAGATIAGDGSGTITIEGRRSLVNAALEGLRYDPPADQNRLGDGGSATFTVLSVGTVNVPVPGGFLYDADNDTVGIGVRPVNDAPVANGSAALESVEEDATNPPGDTVTNLFGGCFTDTADEVSGGSAANTLLGVVVTGSAATVGQGKWQWLDGSTWTDIGTSLTDSSGLFLTTATSIRFLPAADFTGSPGVLTARLVDSSITAPLNGSTQNVSVNGGTTAISAGTVNLGTSVTAVNDAPVVTVPGVQTLDEDTSVVIAGISVADVDAGVATDFATTLTVANGTLTVHAVSGGAVVSGSGTAIVTLTASLDQINATLAALGAVVYRGDRNWNGADTLTVTADDAGNTGAGGAKSDSRTVLITVVPVDDESVVRDDVVTIDEGDVAVGNVLDNDDDIDSELEVVSFQVGDETVPPGAELIIEGVGTISIAIDGSYWFVPETNWHGTVPPVTYTTNTGKSAQLEITVRSVDDPSQLVADAVEVPEGTAVAGNVLGNDSDDDDTLSVTSYSIGGSSYPAGSEVTIPDVGSFVLNADGSFTFTPLPEFNGAVPQITYTTNTGSSTTLDITVTPVDDPSVLRPDWVEVAEDTAATGNVLANDSDVDNALSVAGYSIGGASYPAGSTATISGIGSFQLDLDGSFTFTPEQHWYGLVPRVTYTTNTGASSTLDIVVTPVDDETVVTPDIVTIPEGGVAVGNVLDNDGDADVVLQVVGIVVGGKSYAPGETVSIIGVGSLVINPDGSFTFVPLPDWNGSVPQITYTTNTGASSTLDITVAPVEDPTVVRPDIVTIDEGEAAVGNVLDNDGDADVVLEVVGFTVDGESYAPGETVTIVGVGSLVINRDGSFTFTPLPDWNGTVPPVTYTTNTSASSTLTITVAAVDDPTHVMPDVVTIEEDTAAIGNVLSNDTDIDDTLAIASFRIGGVSYAAGEIVSIDGVGSITITVGGGFVFTPEPNWNGTVPQVTYTTNTGSSSTLDITVTPVDDATVATPDAVTIDEDTVATGNILTNDSDVDDTISVAGYAINGASYEAGATATVAAIGSFVVRADGTFVFTPVANWNGTVPQVTYTTNTRATSTLDIIVMPVEDPSELSPDAATTDEDTVATGNVLTNDSDVDSELVVELFTIDEVSYAAEDEAVIEGVGILTILADGSFVFTPEPDWNGSVPQVTYTTTTGSASTLDITVNPVNDAPVASGSAMLPAVNEDTSSPPGATVSSLFAASFSDTTDEVVGGSSANALTGVVVTGNAATSGQGKWQWLNGSTWTDIGSSLFDSSGLFLTSATNIRFLPAVNFNGTPGSLTVRLVESSIVTPTNGSMQNVSTNGGTTAFSAATVALGTSVTATNNAPVASGSATLAAVNEDTSSPPGETVSNLFVANFGDAADAVAGGSSANTLIGAVVTGNAATSGQGKWQWLNGSTWTDIGSALSDSSGLFLTSATSIRFLPAANFNATPGALTVRLVESSITTPTNGSTQNVSTNGGTTAFSAATVALGTSVTAVNDAPVATGSATLAAVNRNAASPPGATVSSLFAASFSDTADAVAGGSSANALIGVVVIGNAATFGQGKWQWLSGSTWTDIGTSLTDTAGLFLTSATSIRFLPALNFNGTPGSLTVRLAESSIATPTNGSTQNVSTNGGTTAFSAATVSLGTTVTGGNNAPVATGAATLAAVNEDTANPPGATVSSLFAANFSDAADAVPGVSSADTLIGVVVTANAAMSGQGKWQWRNGSTWTDIGTSLTDSSGLFLTSATSVRFLPAANFNGTPGVLTVRLVESSITTPTNGSTQNVSTNGGSTAFSAATVPLGTSVTAVNDAPVATGSATLAAVNEDATNPPGATVSSLFGASFSDDADAVAGGSIANTLIGVVVTGNAATSSQGKWQWLNGSTWTDIGTSLTNSSGLFLTSATSIRFLPVANWSGTPGSLTVRLTESSIVTPTNGSTQNVSTNGGTTAFSAATVPLGTSVTAVNDPPVRTAGTLPTITANEDSANSAAVSLGLSGLAYGPGGGTDEASQTLAYTVTAIPASVMLFKADGTTLVTAGMPITLAELKGLSYKTIPNANGTGSISWTVVDSGSASVPGSNTLTESVSITVTPVNDAPLATGSATLSAVNEDTANPPGATVSSLFGASFSDTTDAVAGGSTANTLIGVVVTGNAATSSQGKWQWLNGSTWTDIGTSLTNSSGLFLTSATSIRFLPAANWNGTPGSLTVRLVESSIAAPASGSTQNVSTNGGTTAFSAATVLLGTSVTAINDAPVATGSATLQAVVRNVTDPPGDTVLALFAGTFGDVTDAVSGGSTAHTLIGVAVTGNAATADQGTWQWFNGSSWNDIPASVADANGLFLTAATKVRFLPKADWSGTPGSLMVRLVDSSIAPPSNGSTQSWSANGGTTAVSSATVELGTIVLPDNAFTDLQVTATNGQDTYVPGASVTYVVTVTNAGPFTVTGARLQSVLPAAIRAADVSWKASYTGGSPAGATSGAGIIDQLLSLAPGGQAVFQVTASVSPTAMSGLATMFTVGPPTGYLDSNPDNNAAIDADRLVIDPTVVFSSDIGCTSQPNVQLVNPTTGAIIRQFMPYEATYIGGIRVTTGDLTGDGIDEIVVAPGRGRVGEIRVFTQWGYELLDYRTTPFGTAYTSGVEVAVGDVTGDGIGDIVASMSAGLSQFSVFRVNPVLADPVIDAPVFTLRPFNAKFVGGISVAVADVGTFANGATVSTSRPDGRGEVIVASGAGLAATVQAYDLSGSAPRLVDTVNPFGGSSRVGLLTLSIGRFNGDAIEDIVVSSGTGGVSAVEVYDGRIDAATPRLAAYAPFADTQRKNAPVSGAALDLDQNGVIDRLVFGQGLGGNLGMVRQIVLGGPPAAPQPSLAATPLRVTALNNKPVAAVATRMAALANLQGQGSVLAKQAAFAAYAAELERVNAGGTKWRR